MADKKFHTGDSVWFKYDNGRKEQKGKITGFDCCGGYLIVGNVDSKLYTVRKEDVSYISPHLRSSTEMNVRPDYDKIPWECKDSVPVQHKFKEGDKIIFNEKNIYGTISKVRSGAALWDYDVIEKDTGELWRVIEKDITGIWDECTFSKDHLDYFRYFPTFNFPTVYAAEVLGIDTDSIKVKKEDKKMKDRPRNHKFVRTELKNRKIQEVIFNGPATIIKWERTIDDICSNKKGDKTVAVCGVTDPYDKEKGFLLAVLKEFVDNQSYDNILRMMDSFNEERK